MCVSVCWANTCFSSPFQYSLKIFARGGAGSDRLFEALQSSQITYTSRLCVATTCSESPRSSPNSKMDPSSRPLQIGSLDACFRHANGDFQLAIGGIYSSFRGYNVHSSRVFIPGEQREQKTRRFKPPRNSRGRYGPRALPGPGASFFSTFSTARHAVSRSRTPPPNWRPISSTRASS